MNQPIIVPVLGKSHLYDLLCEYVFTWKTDQDEWKIIIPAGFNYDGISNPTIFWSATGITPDGLGRAAGLVHDFIYRYQGKLPEGSFLKNGEPCDASWTRVQADKLFANILELSGVSKIRRRIMYIAVRIGGFLPWKM